MVIWLAAVARKEYKETIRGKRLAMDGMTWAVLAESTFIALQYPSAQSCRSVSYLPLSALLGLVADPFHFTAMEMIVSFSSRSPVYLGRHTDEAGSQSLRGIADGIGSAGKPIARRATAGSSHHRKSQMRLN